MKVLPVDGTEADALSAFASTLRVAFEILPACL